MNLYEVRISTGDTIHVVASSIQEAADKANDCVDKKIVTRDDDSIREITLSASQMGTQIPIGGGTHFLVL